MLLPYWWLKHDDSKWQNQDHTICGQTVLTAAGLHLQMPQTAETLHKGHPAENKRAHFASQTHSKPPHCSYKRDKITVTEQDVIICCLLLHDVFFPLTASSHLNVLLNTLCKSVLSTCCYIFEQLDFCALCPGKANAMIIPLNPWLLLLWYLLTIWLKVLHYLFIHCCVSNSRLSHGDITDTWMVHRTLQLLPSYDRSTRFKQSWDWDFLK